MAPARGGTRDPARVESPIATVSVGVVVTVALALSWDFVSGRFADDSAAIAVLLSGNANRENIPDGSFGFRYRMVRRGLLDRGEHPLWRVGPAAARDMLEVIWGKTWTPAIAAAGNYRNTWINLALARGIPWALLWIGTHVWAIFAPRAS